MSWLNITITETGFELLAHIWFIFAFSAAFCLIRLFLAHKHRFVPEDRAWVQTLVIACFELICLFCINGYFLLFTVLLACEFSKGIYNHFFKPDTLGSSLAWAYYIGYLRYIVTDSYWTEVIEKAGLSKKFLYILIPENGFYLPNLVENEYVRQVVALPDHEADIAGTKGRKFHLTQYNFHNGNSFLLEYPATLHTLKEINACRGYTGDHRMRVIDDFHKTLVEIVDSRPELLAKIKIIKYRPKENFMDAVECF